MLHSPIPPDPGGEGDGFELVQSGEDASNQKKLVSIQQKQQQQQPNLAEMIQLWILICFHYITWYLIRLGDAKKLEKHLNHKSIQPTDEAPQTVLDKQHEDFYFPTTLKFQPNTRPSRPISLSVVQDMEVVPEMSAILLDSVTQTSYITTIFEANRFGLSKVMSNIAEELSLWFEKNGLLAIACEMVWNVPIEYRDRFLESRLKDYLFKFIRANNRRVLNLKWKNNNLPLTFPDATTQETSGHEKEFEAFQGVYRRFYGDLLPYQHRQTLGVHKPFWMLKKDEMTPNPGQFLLGNGRKLKELSHTTVVALNLITLKVHKN